MKKRLLIIMLSAAVLGACALNLFIKAQEAAEAKALARTIDSVVEFEIDEPESILSEFED